MSVGRKDESFENNDSSQIFRFIDRDTKVGRSTGGGSGSGVSRRPLQYCADRREQLVHLLGGLVPHDFLPVDNQDHSVYSGFRWGVGLV